MTKIDITPLLVGFDDFDLNIYLCRSGLVNCVRLGSEVISGEPQCVVD